MGKYIDHEGKNLIKLQLSYYFIGAGALLLCLSLKGNWRKNSRCDDVGLWNNDFFVFLFDLIVALN